MRSCTIDRLRQGPLAGHIDLLAARLATHGYSRVHSRIQLRLVGHFNRWLEQKLLTYTQAPPSGSFSARCRSMGSTKRALIFKSGIQGTSLSQDAGVVAKCVHGMVLTICVSWSPLSSDMNPLCRCAPGEICCTGVIVPIQPGLNYFRMRRDPGVGSGRIIEDGYLREPYDEPKRA
jgi:hypothetical protein